ncbi:MAG: ThiF family adenylyltransferase [Gammaproteobacteria bacterium]
MDDRQLTRYSRQLLLPDIDLAGQERLLAARVLLIGAGGLGSPAALYLAGSGIGQLTICDDDQVELSNLHRQIVHNNRDLGRNKAVSATDTLTALNPEIRITPLEKRLQGSLLHKQVAVADVVIDGSDNFPTRYALNAACLANGVPLVSGAVSGLSGQATVFHAAQPDSPCFACLYPEEGKDGNSNCNEQGILAPVAGVIGSILAAETLKILLGLGDSLCGRLLLFDASAMSFRTIRLRRDSHCSACGTYQAPQRQEIR